MTLRLFKRSAKLTAIIPSSVKGEWFSPQANAIEISEMRIQFEIEKDLTKHPNKCNITIFNLAESTRKVFEKKPLLLHLEAGHDGVLRKLFDGDLRYAASELKETDWETKLQCGTGARAFADARVSRSFKSGVPIATVLKEAAGTMGLSVPPEVLQTIGLDQFSSGVVLQGPTRDELTRVLAPYGYNWSIQDNKLQILRDDDVQPGSAVVVNPSNGLIGSPEVSVPEREGTKKGNSPTVKFKCLLYPILAPGILVALQSRAVTGSYKITKVTHKGDTHADDWVTEVECKPL
jgi:hypothetical protein